MIQINAKAETIPQEEVSDNEHVSRHLTGVVNLMDFCSAIYWNSEEISAPELTDGDLLNLWVSPAPFEKSDILILQFNPPVNIGSILLASSDTPKVCLYSKAGNSILHHEI